MVCIRKKGRIGDKIRVFFSRIVSSVSIVPEPAMERSDPPSPKRQKKTEEETTPRYNGRPEGFESDECSDEEMELFDQELDRSGGVGDFYFFSSWLIDLSKFIYLLVCFVRVMKSTSRNFVTVLVGDHWIWTIVQWLMSLKLTEIS